VIPQAFGESSAWSLGIEEELFVVDPVTLLPAQVPAGLLDGRRLKQELFASVVELNTGICESPEQAAAELGELRAAARSGVEAAGLALAAAGTWPTAEPEEQDITDDPGYRAFVEYAGSAARRQYCSGLHVHVGVASAEACLDALEAVLPWLPLVLALSANSPYLAAEETGLASTRAEILALLPRAGPPPVYGSYADWERFAERLVGLGLADSYTRIWWDVRPHPRYGTVELRMPDQPTRPEVTASFAALLQALVADVEPGQPADRGIYAQNRWAALRFGAAAELIHPDGTRLVAVSELLAELLDRLEPVARELGTLDRLAGLEGLDQAGEQLRLGRSDGLPTLCKELIRLS
jgi:carboxylate-amine ligase